MRQMLRFTLVIAPLVWALSAFSFSSATAAGQEKSPDDKVAVVDGTVISRAELDRGVARMAKMQPGRQPGAVSDDKQLRELQEQALETLIRNELLYQASQKAGIIIDDKVVDEQIAQLKKRFPSEEDFKTALAQIPATEDALRQQIRQQMASRQYIDKEFAGKIEIPDQEVKAYYDEHPEYFKVPAQVKASHILAKVDDQKDAAKKAAALDQIKKAQKRLQDGDDFATVAKEMSDGPSKEKGGELGYFSRGQMVKPFEDAAFSLKAGETSDIVETQFGYHLIRVEEEKEEGIVDYSQAQEKIKQFLKRQKLAEMVNKQATELEKSAKIEKFLD